MTFHTFAKKDVLGIAQTGSGKTASYVWPILMNLQRNRTSKNRHIQVLALVPTRELAVQVEDVETHKMHTEYYQVSKETADILNNAKHEQRKIIAVGTTSLRTLETVLRDYDNFVETSGWSDIFIYPGYEFKAIDELIRKRNFLSPPLYTLVIALEKRLRKSGT